MPSFASECAEQFDMLINGKYRVTIFVVNKYERGGVSRMGLSASTRGSISVVCDGYMIYNRGYMHPITCVLHLGDGLFVYGTEVYGEYLKVLKLDPFSTPEGNFVSFGSVSNYKDYNEDWPAKLELDNNVVKATSEQGRITNIKIADLQSC